jgi:hypothetical protein
MLNPPKRTVVDRERDTTVLSGWWTAEPGRDAHRSTEALLAT